MSNNISPYELKNAAWVVIPTRLSPNALFKFCSNIEHVFRLNPYLKIISWSRTNADNYAAEWENYSNEQVVKTSTEIKKTQTKNELLLNYSSGIKVRTYFIIEECSEGAKLTILDDYGDSGQQAVQLVDKSLSVWGQALEKFFAGYRWLHHVPLADRIINRWWIRLSPSGRRIVYILLVITLVEIAALLLLVTLTSLT